MTEEEDEDGENTQVASRAEVMAALKQQPARKSLRPYVIVVNGDSAGRMLPLKSEVVIGRAASADLTLDEDGVSRKHAKLVLGEDGSIELVDLESTNGTFVNGEPVAARTLKDGDKIQIGSVSILKFSYQDALDEALQRNLYDSATRDSLTKAYNKRFFSESLPREIAFASRHRRPLVLVMFDVDHFKKINDGHGHPAGDYVLQTLAELVQQTIRREDVFARYGGEEFALLLRDVSEEQGIACAERVRAVIAETQFAFHGKSIPVTISLGVAAYLGGGGGSNSAEALIVDADRYLYRAKQSGRNQVQALAISGK